jgi:hypothetical protein
MSGSHYDFQEPEFEEWYSTLCADHQHKQNRKFFPAIPDSRNLRISSIQDESEFDDTESSFSSPAISPQPHLQQQSSISLEDYHDYVSKPRSISNSNAQSDSTVLNLLLYIPSSDHPSHRLSLQTPTGIPPHHALESPNLYEFSKYN